MDYSEFSNNVKTNTTAASQAIGKGAAASQKTSGSSKSGNIPIGKSDKPDEIIEKLINSQEFRSLSNQEKLAELKKYFPTADDAKLKSLLENINTKIATTDIEDDETAKPKEIDISEKDTPNLKLNIKDIMQRIKNLAKEANIELDKDALAKLQKLFEGFANGTLDANQLRGGKFQELIKPFAAILDKLSPSPEELKGKTPVEKLEARLDKFINTLIIPGFDNLQDDQKKAIRNNFINQIGKIANPNWDSYNKNTKDLGYTMIAFMLDDEKSGMNFKDLLTKSPDEIKKNFQKIIGNILDKFMGKADITSADLAGKSPDEKLEAIISAACAAAGIKLSGDKESLSQLIDMLGHLLFKNQWTNSNDKNMDSLKDSLALKLLAVKEYNQNHPDDTISFTDFFNSTEVKYEYVMADYENEHEIKLTASQAVHREVIVNLRKEPITYNDILNYLEKIKEQNGGKLEGRYLAEYNRISELKQQLKSKFSKEEIDEILNKPIDDKSNTIAYQIQAQYKGNYNKYLNDHFKLGLGENATPEQIKNTLAKKLENGEITKEQLREFFKRVGDIDTLTALGGAFGLDNTGVYDILGYDSIQAIFSIEIPARRALEFANLAHVDNDKLSDLGINGAAKGYHDLDSPEAKKTISEALFNGKKGKIIAKNIPIKARKQGWTEEEISQFGTDVANNKNIKKENRGQLIDSIIESAPDDNTRVMHSNRFSNNVKDPDMLEYVGAASKYVQDPGKRTQYTTYVTEAAKSYPPETQSRIQKAIETGRVSTSSSESVITPAPRAEVRQPQAEKPRPSIIEDSIPAPAPTQTPSTAQKPQATQDLDEINQRTTAALQQKKDKTLDKIEEYNAKVAADQAVREITDAEIDDFVETLDELDSTEDVSKINQEKIKNFLNSNSVSAIYSKLIEKFGTAIIYKLINAVVAVGNNSKIDALASIIKSGSLMEELFAKCQNKRLLDKLQPSTVKRFIPYMNDLSAVRSDIMYEFIMDLINSNTSIDEIKKYLVYLPFGMQASICETYNNLKGVPLDSDFALKPNRKTESSKEEAQDDKASQSQKAAEPKPAIAANETTAVRNDGVTIKHKSTFAGISDKQDDEAYEVVDNQTGKTKSQREEILTPGSYEWNMKYNKQAPKTAFTMAALNEDEEEGIGIFGSTKVGMGQKIKKKYPPQSFKFNA